MHVHFSIILYRKLTGPGKTGILIPCRGRRQGGYAMAYSQELFSQLRDILDSAGYHTTFEVQGDTGIFSLRMKLRCRLQSVSMMIIVREDNFSTLTTLPLTADENCRLAVSEYLTRANYNMRSGNFEMSMEDGTIRFKTYHHAGDAPLDGKAARLAVLIPFLMIDRFGDGLIDVLFGLKSPREAFESVGQS